MSCEKNILLVIKTQKYTDFCNNFLIGFYVTLIYGFECALLERGRSSKCSLDINKTTWIFEKWFVTVWGKLQGLKDPEKRSSAIKGDHKRYEFGPHAATEEYLIIWKPESWENWTWLSPMWLRRVIKGLYMWTFAMMERVKEVGGSNVNYINCILFNFS